VAVSPGVVSLLSLLLSPARPINHVACRAVTVADQHGSGRSGIFAGHDLQTAIVWSASSPWPAVTRMGLIVGCAASHKCPMRRDWARNATISLGI
jgi:hypothetical protein